ncbi:MAG: DUF3486 family protein, partial [Acidimicrobiia bacterium]|nr:DUF3486 family protein [Acidimicrobiia bacterium]
VPLGAEIMGDNAQAVSRHERAADISRAREAKMRAAIADKAEKEMRAEGLSGDTVARIRQALEANA